MATTVLRKGRSACGAILDRFFFETWQMVTFNNSSFKPIHAERELRGGGGGDKVRAPCSKLSKEGKGRKKLF